MGTSNGISRRRAAADAASMTLDAWLALHAEHGAPTAEPTRLGSLRGTFRRCPCGETYLVLDD